MTIERRVRIIQDTDGWDPRTDTDWNVGRMLCWHSRYNLGDEHSYDSDDWKRELACEADDCLDDEINRLENDVYNKLFDRYLRDNDNGYQPAYDYARRLVSAKIVKLVDCAFDDGYVALPLSLYDHSGISMSTGRPTCPWDSGYVGVIVCDKETIDKEFGGDRDKAEKALESEVKVYDHYLRGDVWGFIAEYRDSDECDDWEHDHDWEHEDSCFGFFGSDPQTNGMAGHVGDDYTDALADAKLEYA